MFPSEKYDDQRVYDLISSGKTLGVFQLESGLLRSYSKKLKPKSLEDIGLLIAIVRPGTLEAIHKKTGLNMAEMCCKVKNREIEADYEFPILKPHLEKTYSVIVYQEQILEIVKDIAGFNLQDADHLRKACSKKIPEEMAKVKVKFLDGCEKTKKVSKAEAEGIWDWIEKSQRYLFNASHSLSYAVLAYQSALLKVKNPKKFYVAWLRHAKDKANSFEEIKNLVNDAKLNDIDVTPPQLFLKNKEFQSFDKYIAFGLSNIRGIGEAAFSKMDLSLKENEALIGSVKTWNWDTFVLTCLNTIGYGVVKGLICSGALDYMGVPRQKMLYEYSTLKEFLTDNDIKFLKGKNIMGGLESITPETKINNRKIPQKKYDQFQSLIQVLKNPPYKLSDSIDFLSFNEELYLGTSLTCSKVDDRDLSNANCSVLDIVKGNVGEYICVGAVVDSARPFTLKKGKNKGADMCFLNISDSTASLDSVVAFTESYKEYKDILQEGNTVLLRGKYEKEKGSFIIEKAWEI